ncbi:MULTISPECIES: GumC domain-containing protein [Streptomyces]|uniref:hypothetical protein n=1 Tax=Streptomyces TaxID=1883 RepID=UPI00163CF55E|nr:MULTISPECIES: hypothetical protein [Streptomyces]MBC2878861.1 hypothetical protein [Streptomyces sp. TYQ1024]UBI38951.1 hypothetical protein K7I03_22505 [Streptomyces mobaraensis]UKW31530.1 hypothetical protein MCU78_22450 [Streptomyces sp. TYQ1024]
MIDDDLAGLKKVATDYTSATEKYDTTSKVLDKKVSSVVHEAGWTGDGADAFQTVWGHDSTIGAALAEAMSQVSDVVTVLSEELEKAKGDLGDVQDTARAAGLTLDSQGGATGKADQQAELDAYQKGRDAALKRAQDARQLATASLNSVLDQMLGKGNPNQYNGADYCTLSEVLRGLYTTPAALTQESAKKLEALKQSAKDLKREARKLPKGGAEWNEKLQQRRAARAALSDQRLRAASVEGWQSKVKGSGAARVTIGEIAENYRVRGAGPMGKFGAVSTGLTGAMVGLQMYDDHRTRGWSYKEAFARDATPAAVGMAAGTYAEGVLVGAATSNPAVAAGVVAAVGIGYGVGTFGYELTHNAHWGSNIHKYGVVSGIGHSFADAGQAWVDNDVKAMWHKGEDTAKAAWHKGTSGVKKVWHGIFG